MEINEIKQFESDIEEYMINEVVWNTTMNCCDGASQDKLEKPSFLNDFLSVFKEEIDSK